MFKTPGQAHSVAVSGTKAYIADHMSGVDVIDVSNPAKPTSTGAFFLDGYARDVVVAGTLAYAIDSPSGFYVFDLTKPGEFEPVTALQSANGRFIDAGPATGGAPTVAAVTGFGGIQFFDISNPRAPVLAATYKTPSGRPQRVSIRGGRAYVADGAEGLHVLDLSTPGKPNLLGSFKTPAPARDVAVAGDSIVVAGPEGIVILQERR